MYPLYVDVQPQQVRRIYICTFNMFKVFGLDFLVKHRIKRNQQCGDMGRQIPRIDYGVQIK
jgi:hypothetical protein